MCYRDCPDRLPLMHVMTRAICDVRVFVYVAERPSTNPIQVVDADIRTVSFARNLVKDTPHWFWTFDQCLPHGGPLTFRLTRGLIVTGVLGTTSVFKQLTSHLDYLYIAFTTRYKTRPQNSVDSVLRADTTSQPKRKSRPRVFDRVEQAKG